MFTQEFPSQFLLVLKRLVQQYYLRSLPGWYYYQSYQTGRVLATSVDTRCKPIYQSNPGSYLSKFAHLLGILDEEVLTDHEWEKTMEKMEH